MLKERDRKFTLFLKNWKTRCIQLFVDSIQFIFCYTKSVDYSILITTIVDPFEQAKKSFCITPPLGFPMHLNTVVPALEKLLCRPCNSVVWAWRQMLTSNSKEEKKEPQLANQSILCCLLLVLSLVCVNYENLVNLWMKIQQFSEPGYYWPFWETELWGDDVRKFNFWNYCSHCFNLDIQKCLFCPKQNFLADLFLLRYDDLLWWLHIVKPFFIWHG